MLFLLLLEVEVCETQKSEDIWRYLHKRSPGATKPAYMTAKHVYHICISQRMAFVYVFVIFTVQPYQSLHFGRSLSFLQLHPLALAAPTVCFLFHAFKTRGAHGENGCWDDVRWHVADAANQLSVY